MLVKQCILKSGNAYLTCWLDANIVKKGMKLTLKDSENPEERWEVLFAGQYTQELEAVTNWARNGKWHKNDFHGTLKGLNIKP